MTNERLAHAWEEIKARNLAEAEEIFRSVAESDPETIDAWNGLGAVHFEHGEVEESLKCYEKALKAALAKHGGAFPKRMAWTDEHKPALRAIHGMGLDFFRMGRYDDARERFETLLRLNPDDNQGAAFLLKDVERKAHLWKKGDGT